VSTVTSRGSIAKTLMNPTPYFPIFVGSSSFVDRNSTRSASSITPIVIPHPSSVTRTAAIPSSARSTVTSSVVAPASMPFCTSSRTKA
jgi:hypothetical protein